MTFSRIDHVALEVADLERSVRFYRDNFGFVLYSDQTTPTGLRIFYLKLGGTVLELMGRQASTMGGFHFCVMTDDFDKAVAALTRAGIRTLMQPHSISAREPGEEGWRRAVFEGPDGEQVEIRG